MHVHNYIVLCDVKVSMILMQRTIIGDVQLTMCMLGREREREGGRKREQHKIASTCIILSRP